jgi:threonine/homoserine/homoserine lactone efflux protein
MLDVETLGLFITASVLVGITPGPAVLYIVARTFDQGRTAGLASVLGVAIGSLVHVAAAVLGVSALLAASTTAFNLVKYAGAAYLVYLGIRKLLERDARPAESIEQFRAPPMPVARIVREGILVNVLNPKTALFFLAFLPQFVRTEAGAPMLQIFLLGIVFMLACILTDTAFALTAAGAGRWLRARLAAASPGALRTQRYLLGGTYIGLGAVTALTGRAAK